MGMFINDISIWEGPSSGEILYKIPNNYDGFFVADSPSYGSAPDLGKIKAVNGTDTITLSKSIKDCDNGIIVYLVSQVVSWITDNGGSSSMYNSNPPVSPTKILIKEDSLTASMTYGRYADVSSPIHGNITVSGNKMRFSTDGISGTGSLVTSDRVAFWAIKGIYSY